MSGGKEKGLALVVSLSVLVVSALLGLSSYQAAQLEERMAGNHRFSVSALQTAESGVNEMLSAVLEYEYSSGDEFCDDIGSSLSGTVFTSPEDGGYSYHSDFDNGEVDLRYKALMKCDSGSGHVLGFSRGVVLDADGNEISARRLRVEIVPPGFDSIHSMLADQSINVTGNSSIIGNVHANGNVDMSIKSTGNDKIVSVGSITATGEVTVKHVSYTDGGECENAVCAASNAPSQKVPSAQEAINLMVSNYLQPSIYSESTTLFQVKDGHESDVTVLPHDSSGDCTTSGSELTPPVGPDGNVIADHVYYCPNNLTASNDFSGVTVMAGGNITHNGQLSIYDATSADTFLVSGGDITLNGSTDPKNDKDAPKDKKDYRPTYASFWSQGSFTQNGGSHIYGAIVAGVGIDVKGGIVFEARDAGRILVPVSGRLEGWVELENPSDEDNIAAGGLG